MTTPDFTPAQLVAAVSSLVALLLTQGLITNHTEKVITGLAAIVIPLGWQVADAVIRHGRSKVAAASINASASAASAEAWKLASAAQAPAKASKPRAVKKK